MHLLTTAATGVGAFAAVIIAVGVAGGFLTVFLAFLPVAFCFFLARCVFALVWWWCDCVCERV